MKEKERIIRNAKLKDIAEEEESQFYAGAQNCSEHASGAYTGEISAEMLASMGVEFCIVGHSERRKYYSDDKQKMAAIEERRALTVSESELMAKLRNCPNIVTYQDDSLRELYIDGKLSTRSYTDREGKEHTVTEVIANDMKILSGKYQPQTGTTETA